MNKDTVKFKPMAWGKSERVRYFKMRWLTVVVIRIIRVVVDKGRVCVKRRVTPGEIKRKN